MRTSRYSRSAVVAARLRMRRRERELSQDELAQQTGVPRSRISDYENDNRPLLFEDALLIAEALDYPIERLAARGRLF